jgi:hypothetical protein
MFLLFIASLLGDWRYAGFATDSAQPDPVAALSAEPMPVEPAPLSCAALTLAESPSPPPPPLPPPLPPPPPPVSPAEADRPTEAPPLQPAPKPAPRRPRTIRVEASPRPVSWRLADRSGQVWEDADPDRLRLWVADRNVASSGAGSGPLSRVRKAILSRRYSAKTLVTL